MKPYAREVYGHIDLIAGIGVVAENPKLVILGVDSFVPHIGEDNVGGKLILIAAINHQFGLHRECSDHTMSLRQGEKADIISRHGQC